MQETFTVTNEFIENTSSLNTVAQKLLFAMMYEIQKQGIKDRYEFSALHLARGIGLQESNMHRNMREAIDQIDTCRWTREDGEDRGGLIYDIRFDKDGTGTIKEALLSKRIKEMLFHDHSKGNYTTLDREEIKKLKGKYTLKLYELIRKNLKTGSFRITVEDLKYHLKAPLSYRYSYIDRDCLKKAQKRINEHCSFNIAYSGVRVGASTKHVDFVITPKDSDNIICKKTAEHIAWECEMRNKNGVTISIINKVITKHRLIIEHMIRFWNESLKDEAAEIPLKFRGKFIKDSYDPEADIGLRFQVASSEYVIEELKNPEKFKIDLSSIPKL